MVDKERKECKKGFPCGKSCIARSRKCKSNLDPKGKKLVETFADYVARIAIEDSVEEDPLLGITPVGDPEMDGLGESTLTPLEEVVDELPAPIGKDSIPSNAKFGNTKVYKKLVETKRNNLKAYLGEAKFERFTQEAKEYFKDFEPVVYINQEVINEIVKSGDLQLKNQFETGTSGGLLDSSKRTLVEDEVLGVPSDTEGSERPIYAGFHKPDKKHGDYHFYGDMAFKIKGLSTKDYTFTNNDSLAGHNFATGLNDQRLTIAQHQDSDDILVAMYNDPNISFMDMASYDSFADYMESNEVNYNEAQIYKRPVTLNDLELVKGSRKNKLTPEAKKALGLTKPTAKSKNPSMTPTDVSKRVISGKPPISSSDKKAISELVETGFGRFSPKFKKASKFSEPHEAMALASWVHDHYAKFNGEVIGYPTSDIEWSASPFGKGYDTELSMALASGLAKAPKPTKTHVKKAHGTKRANEYTDALKRESHPLKRGVSLDNATAKNEIAKYAANMGENVEIGHFFATSYDPMVAEMFGGIPSEGTTTVFYEVQPKSTRTTKARHMDFLKNAAFESELLYPPDTNFEVQEIIDNGSGKVTIKLKEV